MSDDQIAGIRPDALAPAQIETKAEAVGEAKAGMGTRQTFVLACLAGLFIGMGGMFMLLVKSDSTLPFATSQLLGGLAFSLGLFAVVMAGAELFTGNSLMICGRLSGRYSRRQLAHSWTVVYLGNLVGSLALVLLLTLANFRGMNSGAVGATAVTVAAAKINQGWWVIFFRGVMCNVLVCLAVWMSFGARTAVDKLCVVTLPVIAFVACGFEHCVANMFFLPMGLATMLSGVVPQGVDMSALNLGGIVWNLSASTLGNLAGGVCIIGLSYWLAYARRDAEVVRDRA